MDVVIDSVWDKLPPIMRAMADDETFGRYELHKPHRAGEYVFACDRVALIRWANADVEIPPSNWPNITKDVGDWMTYSRRAEPIVCPDAEVTETTCDECNGTGKANCSRCDGTGERECGECGQDCDCDDCDGGKVDCDCEGGTKSNSHKLIEITPGVWMQRRYAKALHSINARVWVAENRRSHYFKGDNGLDGFVMWHEGPTNAD